MLKPYIQGITNESQENLDYYIDHAKGFLDTQNNYNFEIVEKMAKGLMINPETISSIKKETLVKKVLAVLRKDLTYVARRNREYRREDIRNESNNKILSKLIEKDLIKYSRDADVDILNRVFSVFNPCRKKLKLTNKSVIELYAKTDTEHRNSDGHRYDHYELFAEGYVIIDGISHDFERISIKGWGYDNFPAS